MYKTVANISKSINIPIISLRVIHIRCAYTIKILERLVFERGKPTAIRVDNGPEFISSALSEWCLDKQIKLVYIQPGKPMQNGYIELFNRSYREDVLDANLFENIHQARMLSDYFQEDYNLHRPHESLGNLSAINYKLKSCG